MFFFVEIIHINLDNYIILMFKMYADNKRNLSLYLIFKSAYCLGFAFFMVFLNFSQWHMVYMKIGCEKTDEGECNVFGISHAALSTVHTPTALSPLSPSHSHHLSHG